LFGKSLARATAGRGWLAFMTHRIELSLLGHFRIKVREHVRPCCCLRKFVSSDLRHEIRRVAHERCHGRKTLARLRQHFWAAHPEKDEQDVRVRAYQHRTGSQAQSIDDCTMITWIDKWRAGGRAADGQVDGRMHVDL